MCVCAPCCKRHPARRAALTGRDAAFSFTALHGAPLVPLEIERFPSARAHACESTACLRRSVQESAAEGSRDLASSVQLERARTQLRPSSSLWIAFSSV